MTDSKNTAPIVAKVARKDTDTLTSEEKSALNSALAKIAFKLGIPVVIAAGASTGLASWASNQDTATKADIQEVLEKIDKGDVERASLELRVRDAERKDDRAEFRFARNEAEIKQLRTEIEKLKEAK